MIFSRRLDLFGRRREGGVAGRDLAGMDHRLAVEAEAPGLRAGGGETFRIGDVVVHAVDDRKPVGARRQHRKPQRRRQVERGPACARRPSP